MPTVKELRKIASGLKIPGRSKMNKAALITAISASHKRKSKSRKSKSRKRTPKKKSRRGKSKKGMKSRRRHKFRLGTKFKYRMERGEVPKAKTQEELERMIDAKIRDIRLMKIKNIKKKYNPRPGRGGVGEWRDDETEKAEDALQDIIDRIAANKIQSNPIINKKLRMHKTFGAYLTGNPESEEKEVQKIFLESRN